MSDTNSKAKPTAGPTRYRRETDGSFGEHPEGDLTDWFEYEALSTRVRELEAALRLVSLTLWNRDPSRSERDALCINIRALLPQAAATQKVDARYERTAFCLMEMMQAYERRIRSECKNPEQLAARPWECREWLAAADALKKAWPAYSAALLPQVPTNVGDGK